jgi:serine/threonine protein kinase
MCGWSAATGRLWKTSDLLHYFAKPAKGHFPMGTPGQLIVKRYRLVRALGQGGMGMVWEGYDTLLDRPVAAKEVLVPPKLSSRQRLDMIHRTSREARTAARLNHRNIVSVFDVAEEDGQPWIIMEMVPSRSLDRVIAGEGPLSVARAAAIASHVLTALEVAHAADIVHRDVKPANILIGYDGRVVLSDFGIATSLSDPHAQHSGTIGSSGFLAPERAAGAPATPAADLWSLGATLFAMVVCRPPFAGDMGPLATLLSLARISTRAAAPSEIDDEFAGVTVPPCRKAGFSVGIFSGRAFFGCSSDLTSTEPLRVSTVTDAISVSNRPSSCADSAPDSDSSA